MPKFKLVVREEPINARACGYGVKDRRAVDPAPIIEVKLNYEAGEQEVPIFLVKNHPMLVLQASIWSVTGQEKLPLKSLDDLLTGSLVVNASLLKDDTGVAGCFFTFADISIRSPGSYRLKFTLFDLGDTGVLSTGNQAAVTSVFSQVLSCFSPKDYPGKLDPPPLIRTFAQSLPMPIRKSKNTRESEDTTT
ncbi:velvet factor [Globomyces pollinis-pini]|nr:velvet factor [Globomyces pollinis-pini]